MPQKPMRPCRYPGCPHLTGDKSGYCAEHLKLMRKESDRQRGNSTERGYNYRWQKASKYFLNNHPLCFYCQQKDPPVIRAATLVDHFKPHKGDYELFWDENNWRASCKECHDAKTAREDGGFGNAVR